MLQVDWKEDTLRLEPSDPSQKDTTLPCNDGPADQSTFELILDVFRSKLRRATETHRERDMTYKIELFEKLPTVATEMDQAGVWDIAYSFCLCHRDLEPRNILVGEQDITGILDWDSALFAPPPAVMPSPSVALGMV